MKLKLHRRFLGETYTIGSLFDEFGTLICDTIEDKVRDYNKDGDLLDAGETKIFGETAIPYGTYEVDLTWSPKFKRLLPLVKNVPHFTGIRIHRGNTAGDSHGCILPGENKVKGKVIHSTKWEGEITVMILEAIRRGEKITLEIV
jgi:hypothetical protein